MQDTNLIHEQIFIAAFHRTSADFLVKGMSGIGQVYLYMVLILDGNSGVGPRV